MTWWEIAIAVVLLIPAAWYGINVLFWFVFWLLASNAIEYLIYAAIVVSTLGGVYMLGHGLGLWGWVPW